MFDLVKISLRNMSRRKGRTICIFFSGVIVILFITIICFIASSIYETLGGYLRSGRTWDGDAGLYVYSDEDVQLIENSKSVKESCEGYFLGGILCNDGTENLKNEISYYTDEMCQWMHCNVKEGRLPKAQNEIVVSDNFMEENGLDLDDNSVITLNYVIADKAVTDEFTVVGYYDSSEAVKDVVLVSKDYYELKRNETAYDETSFPILVEVVYWQNHNYESLTEDLMKSISLNIDTAEYIVNTDVDNNMGYGIIVSAFAIIVFIVIIGALLIIDSYEVSVSNDIKFYKSLYVLGLTRKELFGIFYFQIQMMTFFSLLIGIPVSYAVSKYMIIPLISRNINVDLEMSVRLWNFIFPIVLFLMMVVLCSLRINSYIHKEIILSDKGRKVQKYRKKHGRIFSDLLLKMTIRRIGAHKAGFVMITAMLFLGVVLCDGIDTYVRGFNIEEYISESLYADYIVHSSSFSEDIENRKPFVKDEISEVEELDGLQESGGASVSEMNIVLDDSAKVKYKDLQIETTEDTMYTNIYGLDDIFVKKMDVLDGEVDLQKFSTGKYVLIDSFGEDDGSSVWNVGDIISLNGPAGVESEYTVMAIVSLPYDLTYQSKWGDSQDIFLPEVEWQRLMGKEDYYAYMYKVDKSERVKWDDCLGRIISADDNIIYDSAKTKFEENKNYFKQLRLFSILFMSTIFTVVIGGFFNIIINELIGLKQELINLQRIGVGKNELMKQFILESSLYLLLGIISGIIVSPFFTRVLIQDVIAEKYVIYRYSPLLSLAYLLAGGILICVVGVIYRRNVCAMNK